MYQQTNFLSPLCKSVAGLYLISLRAKLILVCVNTTSPFLGIGSAIHLALAFNSLSKMLTSLLTGTGEVFLRLQTRNCAFPFFFPPLLVLFPAVSNAAKRPFRVKGYFRELKKKYALGVWAVYWVLGN